MAPKAKNDSLWNWLGRQIGHVKKAVTTDVARPAVQPPPPAPPQPPPPQPEAPQPQQPKVIYRDQKAEEVELPDRPGVKLRRTVIDEVIVDENKKSDQAH
jgi:hypothetical protein